jgi:hypothetical protein
LQTDNHYGEKIWRLLKNLKINLPYDPVIPLLGIYLKECNTDYSKDICIPMFTAALFTIAKLWKQPRCPTTDEWIKPILLKMYMHIIFHDIFVMGNILGSHFSLPGFFCNIILRNIIKTVENF